mgnify:CR=1 FL=1
MFPWGALISLAGTGLSAGLSAINNKRARQEEEAEAARREAHYEAKANENPLSRSENQHLLGQYDRSAQQQVENARNVAAITGATPEYGLAVQKGVAENRANLMGQMAAGASVRADKYEEMAEGARQDRAAAQQAYRQQRNEQFANLAANAASSFGSLVDATAGLGGNKAKTPSVSGGEQTTSEKIAAAPSRAAQFQEAANATKSDVEKQVYTDTANAAANAAKIASGAAAPMNKPAADGIHVQDSVGYTDNGDGTYSKDGVRYYKNFDGSYGRVN